MLYFTDLISQEVLSEQSLGNIENDPKMMARSLIFIKSAFSCVL